VARPAPSVGLDTAVVRAATMMRAAGLRLLPVVDADRRGALVGVVTAVGLAAAEELRALDDDRAPASEPARDRGAAPGLLRPVEE